jgi:hypothetical protein
MTVRWTGVDKFSKFLRETPGLVMKDLEAAMAEEGENVMGVSKRRTPVDTGRLRSTGHVKPPERKTGKVSVTLAYGTDYAAVVHETHGTKSKFLESAVKDNAKGMPGRLRARVLDRIGKR